MSGARERKRYVRCVKNSGCEDSLKLNAIYSCKLDPLAFKFGLLSLVDESGESNSYPLEMFEFVEVPEGPAS